MPVDVSKYGGIIKYEFTPETAIQDIATIQDKQPPSRLHLSVSIMYCIAVSGTINGQKII